MAQRRRPPNKRQQRQASIQATPPATARPAAVRKPPTRYGDSFVLLEDDNKNTFVFSSGNWTAHTMSIAECKEVCQVKELPQKVNGMVRYEVRCPVGM